MSSIPALEAPTLKRLGTREPFRHRSGLSPAAGIGFGLDALAIEGRARRAAAT